jgi:hypothetical protein
MNARQIGAAIGVVTLVASGSYVFVYLQRWEWNRALMSGVMFLAAEVALATLLLAGRLRRLAADTATLRVEVRQQHQQRTLQHLQDTAPEPRDHFAWISRPQHMSVFVPVLLGAGVLLSGLAWLVERLGRLTARPALERGLARRLDVLAPPAGGFLAADVPGIAGVGGPTDQAVGMLRRPTTTAATSTRP